MQNPWYHAVPYVLDQVELIRPRSILEIGTGIGKYGTMFRQVLEPAWPRSKLGRTTIHGVELGGTDPVGCEAYDRVHRVDLFRGSAAAPEGPKRAAYTELVVLLSELPVYDFILLDGVLEALDKETGLDLIRRLLKRTRHSVMVTVLVDPFPQFAKLAALVPEGAAGEVSAAGKKGDGTRGTRWGVPDFLDFDFSWKIVQGRQNGVHVFHFFPPGREGNGDYVGPTEPARGDTGPGRCLTIGYVIPHLNVTGGMRMLLEQIRHLRQKGHRVIAVRRARRGERVLPDWTDVRADGEAVVPPEGSYGDVLKGLDVVVAGWCAQLPELGGHGVPVAYWEQGHEALFGQVDDLSRDCLLRARVSRYYEQPCHLAASSDAVARALRARFGREACVIPPGIDTELFRPGRRPGQGVVLLVGNPFLPFKGFDVALRVLTRVAETGVRFKVRWVCQVVPHLTGSVSFPLEIIPNPSVERLAEVYRTSDVFLFTSWYEGFGLPPIEAMASGLPVVTTLCGGNASYIVPGENALAADPGDVDSLAFAVSYLLKDKEAADYLARNGRQTALQFDIGRSVSLLERWLVEVVAGRPQ